MSSHPAVTRAANEIAEELHSHTSGRNGGRLRQSETERIAEAIIERETHYTELIEAAKGMIGPSHMDDRGYCRHCFAHVETQDHRDWCEYDRLRTILEKLEVKP